MRVSIECVRIGKESWKMGGSRVKAEKWHEQPPDQEAVSADIIDLQSKLYLEVRAAFWKVLAFERDGMAIEAEAARQDCLKAAQQLRRSFDSHPKVGPDAADGMIAWAVHYARNDFANDLRHHTNWRDSHQWQPQALRRTQG
jgi:hypothetical protein